MSKNIQFPKNVYPFAPVSFHDWNMYKIVDSMRDMNRKGISCRQRPYGNAIGRRKAVQSQLKKLYGAEVEINLILQLKYLEEAKKVMASVCVPGFCNNMLDRGQFQYMALGCVTISPKLPELLPYKCRPVPNVHYLCCKDDYSNLPDLVDECRKYPERVRIIGEMGQSLFRECCTPEQLFNWIRRVLQT